MKNQAPKLRVKLLMDWTSLQIFRGDGRFYMPMAAKFAKDDHRLALLAAGAPVRFNRLEVNELRSVRPQKPESH